MPEFAPVTTDSPDRFWWQTEETCAVVTPRVGDICQACEQGRLDYNSQFQLACPVCGHVAEAGAFT